MWSSRNESITDGTVDVLARRLPNLGERHWHKVRIDHLFSLSPMSCSAS